MIPRGQGHGSPGAASVVAEVGATLRKTLGTQGWRGPARAAAPLATCLFIAAYGPAASALRVLVNWLALLSYFWLLAWGLRACFAARNPGAEGGEIALRHHLWRLVLAHLATVGVPYGGLLVLPMLPGVAAGTQSHITTVLMLALFPAAILAALAGAQVAARGIWSPLALWRALRGGRVPALGFMTGGVLIAWGFGPLLLLMVLPLLGTGAAGLGAGFVLTVAALGGLALLLAACATVLFERHAHETARVTPTYDA